MEHRKIMRVRDLPSDWAMAGRGGLLVDLALSCPRALLSMTLGGTVRSWLAFYISNMGDLEWEFIKAVLPNWPKCAGGHGIDELDQEHDPGTGCG